MAFRSGLEEKVADLLVTLGVDYEYEETSYPYTIQHSYTPDFVLPDNGVILEVKGYWDPPSRRKIKQVIKVITNDAQTNMPYPFIEIKFCIIFFLSFFSLF